MAQKQYRMGMELVPESGMRKWHHDRGLPWGPLYEGPDPVTIRLMARQVLVNITVHLANEHKINPGPYEENQVQHMLAHLYGIFRAGQEHYHQRPEREPPGKGVKG